MEDFTKLFNDEAKDLLGKLEETLLQLEEDLSNYELVNEVFRIMHSLKGSGAMFGYKNLSDFTHELETLYDKIRSQEIKLNTDIIGFTMSVGDHISQLLHADDDPELLSQTNKHKAHINSLLKDIAPVNKGSEVPDTVSEPEKSDLKKSIYYIKFEPNEDILNDGTNPLYLVDELVDLGETLIRINSEKLQDFDDFNPSKCKLSWTIILSTEAGKSDIEDVFIFVNIDSKITIELLSEKDLFSLHNCRSSLSYILDNKPDEPDSFLSIIDALETDYEQTTTNKTYIEEVAEVLTDPEKTEEKEAVVNKAKPFQNETISIETVKVASSKLDSLINLVSELVTTQARLVNLANEVNSTELVILSEDFQQLSRQFRDIAFDMRLIPIQTMIVKFKRLTRDLSKKLNKKVVFITEGTETELDKTIIATISDPIMHIIRNAIDHGIESPQKRIEQGKPEIGTIHLEASLSGTSIIIQITDDGAGIDTQNVLHKALEKNLVQPTDDLSDKEILKLLMQPGFSTNEVVTDVSGRGVGMDVVRKKINDLRGEVSLSSEQGKGTEVTIRLPLTLSIIDGLLVTINNDRFVIPLSSVKQIHKVSADAVNSAINNVINVDGTQFPFINLPRVFGNSDEKSTEIHFITVGYQKKVVGLVVNELLSEYQAVLKPIGKILEHDEIFAGASILGDGKVALVLDTNKLIDFYSNRKVDKNDK